MRYTGLMYEWLELCGGIHCDLQMGQYETEWLDTRQRHRLLFLIDVGDIAQGGTVDFELHEALDAVGTGAKVIAGKAITQLVQANGDGNGFFAIDCRTEEMDADGRFCFIRGRLDVLVAAANVGVWAFGEPTRYKPADQSQWTETVPTP